MGAKDNFFFQFCPDAVLNPQRGYITRTVVKHASPVLLGLTEPLYLGCDLSRNLTKYPS